MSPPPARTGICPRCGEPVFAGELADGTRALRCPGCVRISQNRKDHGKRWNWRKRSEG